MLNTYRTRRAEGRKPKNLLLSQPAIEAGERIAKSENTVLSDVVETLLLRAAKQKRNICRVAV